MEDFVIYAAIAVGLVVLGLLVGGANERMHFRSLARREAKFRDISVCNMKSVPSSIVNSISGNAAEGRANIFRGLIREAKFIPRSVVTPVLL